MPATTMQQSLDLFVYELSYMYAFEQHNVETLQALADEVTGEQARHPIVHHLKETREQLGLLEQCFALLKVSLKKVVVHTAKGMQQDHDAFVKLEPDPALLTLYDLNAASKVEHLEVAAYRGLINQGMVTGQKEVVRLLRQILKQEEDAVKELEAAAKELGAQTLPELAATSA
jgi:ferritin-like metal-binding protein YciE